MSQILTGKPELSGWYLVKIPNGQLVESYYFGGEFDWPGVVGYYPEKFCSYNEAREHKVNHA